MTDETAHPNGNVYLDTPFGLVRYVRSDAESSGRAPKKEQVDSSATARGSSLVIDGEVWVLAQAIDRAMACNSSAVGCGREVQ